MPCLKHSISTMVVASRLCTNVQPRYWCHLFEATYAENTLIESFHPDIGFCASLKVKDGYELAQSDPEHALEAATISQSESDRDVEPRL